MHQATGGAFAADTRPEGFSRRPDSRALSGHANSLNLLARANLLAAVWCACQINTNLAREREIFSLARLLNIIMLTF